MEEYFSMLPEIAVPRLGTPGERHRDRQLAIQLPKQDLARAYCRHLDPKHASSADDFMAARNEIALDIGSVQEVLERDLVSTASAFSNKNKKFLKIEILCKIKVSTRSPATNEIFSQMTGKPRHKIGINSE